MVFFINWYGRFFALAFIQNGTVKRSMEEIKNKYGRLSVMKESCSEKLLFKKKSYFKK